MKKILTLILALVMVFALCACGGTNDDNIASSTPSPTPDNSSDATPDTGSENNEPKDTTLVIGFTTAPGNYDPFGRGRTRYGSKMLFEGLATVDPDTGEYVPKLAEAWEWTDNLTLEINLRDDVYFTDGQHMTSSDVIYSLRDVWAVGSMSSRFVAFDWDNCSTPDDYTIILKFTREYGPAIGYLTHYDIYCQETIENSTVDDFLYRPNGTAPYYLTENVSGSHCTFVRKGAADYWGELPECTQVTYKYYAEQSTMYIDFETGTLDVACDLNSSDAARVINGGAPAGTEYSLASLKDTLMCMLPEDAEAFQDIRIREAFMISVDWNAVSESVYGVLYIPATSSLATEVNYYVNIGQYEYNLDRAKELMKEAGYEGKTIDIRHICTTGNDTVAEAIQACVKEVGFNISIECYDMATAIPMMREGLSDFITKQAEGGAYNLEPDMIYDTLSPESTLPPARQSTPEWTELFYMGLYNLDEAVRAEAYAGMQNYLKDEFRVAAICERANMTVWNGNKIAEFPMPVADEPVVLWLKFA